MDPDVLAALYPESYSEPDTVIKHDHWCPKCGDWLECSDRDCEEAEELECGVCK